MLGGGETGYPRHFPKLQGVFGKSSNATFIALVPKKKGAKDLWDFRPLSLIGNVYKLLSKILTEKLKGVISNFVILIK